MQGDTQHTLAASRGGLITAWQLGRRWCRAGARAWTGAAGAGAGDIDGPFAHNHPLVDVKALVEVYANGLVAHLGGRETTGA